MFHFCSDINVSLYTFLCLFLSSHDFITSVSCHPLNVNCVMFQNICCKDNILSSCRFKGLVKLIIYYIFYQYLLILVSNARWIFEHCSMLEGRKYKTGARSFMAFSRKESRVTARIEYGYSFANLYRRYVV